MLYEFVGHCLSNIVISVLFVLNTLFKILLLGKINRARCYFNYFMMYFTLFLTGVLFIPLFKFRPGDIKNIHLMTAPFIYVAKEVFGLELTIRNPKSLIKDEAAVIVTNHQSHVDMMLLFQMWDRLTDKMFPLSKQELSKIFLYGTLNNLVGVKFINRTSAIDAYKSLDDIGDTIVNGKSKVWIFPEGTRTKDINNFSNFKPGAFYVAVKTQSPIIPIVTSPFYFLNDKKIPFKKPRVIMEVLDEVPTVGLTKADLPELARKVQAQMFEVYKRLHEECKYLDRDGKNYPLPGNTVLA